MPVTYDMDLGGGLESMDSTNEAWPYERCTVIVNQEGLCFAEIANLYEVTGVQVKQVKMGIPQIAEIFEKMIKIKNSDLGSQGTVDCDQKISRCRRVICGSMIPVQTAAAVFWFRCGISTGRQE